MIWFWISAGIFVAWLVAWLQNASNPVLWGLTLAWIVTLNIGAMSHKYRPRVQEREKEQKPAA